MPTFQVVSVDHEIKPWRTKDGQRAFIDYSIHVDGPEGRGGPLLLTRLPSSEAPVEGDTLEGFEIVHENGRAKIKKEKQAAGAQGRSGASGGGYGKSDQERAEIRRSVAVKAAVELLGIEVGSGMIPQDRLTGAKASELLQARIQFLDDALKVQG